MLEEPDLFLGNEVHSTGFSFKINDGNAVVQFDHYPPAGKREYHKSGTVCIIHRSFDLDTKLTPQETQAFKVFVGRAYLHPKDNYDHVEGEKLSLKRALMQINDKETRRKFWDVWLSIKKEEEEAEMVDFLIDHIDELIEEMKKHVG